MLLPGCTSGASLYPQMSLRDSKFALGLRPGQRNTDLYSLISSEDQSVRDSFRKSDSGQTRVARRLC